MLKQRNLPSTVWVSFGTLHLAVLRNMIRIAWSLVCVLLAVLWTHCALADDTTLGGAHVGYSIGSSSAEHNSGLRHGLGLALMPILFITAHNPGVQAIASNSGFTAGPSGIIGFGKTPDYLAFDFGYGQSTIVGLLAGVGPVYRFASARMLGAVGFETRLMADVVFIESGLRVMSVFGRDDSSEVIATVFIGFGRF